VVSGILLPLFFKRISPLFSLAFHILSGTTFPKHIMVQKRQRAKEERKRDGEQKGTFSPGGLLFETS
jgi:hypothetical protein